MHGAATAIANNVEWCDLVCRVHGVSTATRPGVWLAEARPPALYPDAITTQGQTPVATVVGLLEGRSECSVKDSWADLDLSAEGFVELISARWIGRDSTDDDTAALRWSVLDQPEQVAQWETAAGLRGVLMPELLSDPLVRILLARRDDDIVGGAIANRSSSVVGVSNVFTTADNDVPALWADIPGAVAGFFPGLALVGYEHGADLDGARAAGFSELGAVRVWQRRE